MYELLLYLQVHYKEGILISCILAVSVHLYFSYLMTIYSHYNGYNTYVSCYIPVYNVGILIYIKSVKIFSKIKARVLLKRQQKLLKKQEKLLKKQQQSEDPTDEGTSDNK